MDAYGIRDTRTVCGRTEIAQSANNKDQEPGKKLSLTRAALTGTGIILSLLVIVLFYLAVAWMVGLLPHAELGTGNYVAAASLTVFVAVVVSIMGESLIEDIVKFVLFASTAIIVFSSFGPVIQSLVIAVPVGAGLPFLIRPVFSGLK